MQRIDGPTRSATLPAPSAAGTGASSPGFFTRGDPIAGTPPTTLDADWANMVQEELIAPVVAAGLAPDKADHGQLLAALRVLFVAAGTGSGVTVKNGEVTIPLPGGYYLKLGSTAIGSGSNTITGAITFTTPFPAACLFVGGNADGRANANWGPIAVMVSPIDKASAAFIADTANQSQSISAGRSICWLAVGN